MLDNTKKAMSFIAVAGALSAMSWLYYSNILDDGANTSFMSENVEALTRSESHGGYTECPGPKKYERSGVVTKYTSERSHFTDSIDIVTSYKIRECQACGDGSLEGNNSLLSKTMTNREYVKCQH